MSSRTSERSERVSGSPSPNEEMDRRSSSRHSLRSCGTRDALMRSELPQLAMNVRHRAEDERYLAAHAAAPQDAEQTDDARSAPLQEHRRTAVTARDVPANPVLAALHDRRNRPQDDGVDACLDHRAEGPSCRA